MIVVNYINIMALVNDINIMIVTDLLDLRNNNYI